MEALGQHILGEYYQADPHILNDPGLIEAALTEAAQAAGATIIQSTVHHFAPQGVSGVIIIQESHLTIHTWPELGYAAVDIFTCGSEVSPQRAYEALIASLGARDSSSRLIPRGAGLTGMAPRVSLHEQSRLRQLWFTERNADLALSLRYAAPKLHDQQSDSQRIEVFQSDTFGRVMALNGRLVITGGDEFAYHEMMVHPIMQGPDPAREILILGGGDGALVRELMRYPEIDHIQLVEQDPSVSQLSRQFFPEIFAAWDEANISIEWAEAAAFLARSDRKWDIVFLDFPAPSQDLMDRVVQHLHEAGRWVAPLGAPHYVPASWHKAIKAWERPDWNIWPYLLYQPTAPGGAQTLVMGSRKHSAHSPAYWEAKPPKGLRYYTAEIHQAAFALPAQLRQAL